MGEETWKVEAIAKNLLLSLQKKLITSGQRTGMVGCGRENLINVETAQ